MFGSSSALGRHRKAAGHTARQMKKVNSNDKSVKTKVATNIKSSAGKRASNSIDYFMKPAKQSKLNFASAGCSKDSVCQKDASDDFEYSSQEESDVEDECCAAGNCIMDDSDNIQWIMCEICDEWFHAKCVGQGDKTAEELEAIVDYCCPRCEKIKQKISVV